MSKESKLAELRARTDFELIRYVKNELTAGIRFASSPDELSRARAEEAYAEVEKLLPVLSGPMERRQLMNQFEYLGELLNPERALAQAAC
jgi:hypothetical protein